VAAATLAQRPATVARTFGLQRVEILAAAANAVVLFALAAYILVEAARRLSDPPEIGSGLMLTVALVGLVANAVSLGFLHRGQGESLNVRGAYLEVLGDLLREAIDILLEATPKNVDLHQVREHILAMPGVIDVHDVHAWAITSGQPVLSAHVVVDDDATAGGHTAVLDELGECLAGHFDVEHCTFQVEPRRHRDHEPVLHR
jgi:cobalt-zinc-cadmium efflux system protein